MRQWGSEMGAGERGVWLGSREKLGAGRAGAGRGGQATNLCMWQQALYVLGHTGRVVCSGAANAFDHVHAIARFSADRTVVLRASKVGSLLGHLSQLQALRTPESYCSMSIRFWISLWGLWGWGGGRGQNKGRTKGGRGRRSGAAHKGKDKKV